MRRNVARSRRLSPSAGRARVGPQVAVVARCRAERPTSRETSSSAHPISSSGTTAPTRTERRRTRACRRRRDRGSRRFACRSPRFLVRARARRAPLTLLGRNGATSAGSTANASSGRSKGGGGSSTTLPSASSERVSQAVSPAKTTVSREPVEGCRPARGSRRADRRASTRGSRAAARSASASGMPREASVARRWVRGSPRRCAGSCAGSRWYSKWLPSGTMNRPPHANPHRSITRTSLGSWSGGMP